MANICVLSGLEIPKGKESREHWLPKSRFPKSVWNNPKNIYKSHYILNGIKGSCLPCEWQELKFKLTVHALQKWRLSPDDRVFLILAMHHWLVWEQNPCELCIAKCNERIK